MKSLKASNMLYTNFLVKVREYEDRFDTKMEKLPPSILQAIFDQLIKQETDYEEAS